MPLAFRVVDSAHLVPPPAWQSAGVCRRAAAACACFCLRTHHIHHSLLIKDRVLLQQLLMSGAGAAALQQITQSGAKTPRSHFLCLNSSSGGAVCTYLEAHHLYSLKPMGSGAYVWHALRPDADADARASARGSSRLGLLSWEKMQRFAGGQESASCRRDGDMHVAYRYTLTQQSSCQVCVPLCHTSQSRLLLSSAPVAAPPVCSSSARATRRDTRCRRAKVEHKTRHPCLLERPFALHQYPHTSLFTLSIEAPPFKPW